MQQHHARKLLFVALLVGAAVAAFLLAGTGPVSAAAASLGLFGTGVLILQALDLVGHVVNHGKLKVAHARLDAADERGARVAQQLDELHGTFAGENLHERVRAAVRSTLEDIAREQEAAMAEAAAHGMRGGHDPAELNERRASVEDARAAAEVAIAAKLTEVLGNEDLASACIAWTKKNSASAWRRATRAFAEGRMDAVHAILAPGVQRYKLGTTPARPAPQQATGWDAPPF